jgi:hypothetical protein
MGDRLVIAENKVGKIKLKEEHRKKIMSRVTEL